MKVLFAVNNESISESIIKRYQQEYKEIISVKNVYYFNAIIKELQRDKSYDRIIISEDLEPFSNNNYDAIDKFVFEKMDSISDEATNLSGNDIPIILICADRREKSEALLVKLFGIGVYNALIGKDRSITEVCELINRPRGKKKAKAYYRIDSDNVDYKVENEGDVSEVEIQNILSHYKKLGKNEEKYVESFEHIASQYSDSQLRLIAKFLPLNVKAVLEANSMKYQEIISFGAPSSKPAQAREEQTKNVKPSKQPKQKKSKQPEIDLVEKNLSQNRITEPVIIPSAVNTANVRKVKESTMDNNQNQGIDDILGDISAPNIANTQPEPIIEGFDDMETMMQNETGLSEPTVSNAEPIMPKKDQMMQKQENTVQNVENEMPKSGSKAKSEPQEEVLVAQPKRRGRPKKNATDEVTNNTVNDEPKKRRGRPKKEVVMENQTQVEEPSVIPNSPVNLFELGEEDSTPTTTNNNGSYSDMILPGLDDDEMMYMQETTSQEPLVGGIEQTSPSSMKKTREQISQPDPTTEMYEQENIVPLGMQSNQNSMEMESSQNSIRMQEDQNSMNIRANQNQMGMQVEQNPMSMQENMQNPIRNFGTATTQAVQNAGKYNLTNADLSGLLTRDKKVVAFVGTSKNGTSFLVNNLAEMLSKKGIRTAVLDLTQNKNDYYIYTENEENLRKIAYDAMGSLRRGSPSGIQVNKNLTVYTTLPGENEDINDYANILETLIKNYSLILLDCDFETNYGYFKEAQELYLVQSLDVLTIQPLTAFLRDLKAKNVLKPEKIRIALNKVVKVRSLTEKTIIGGMAYYNDPAMSFMTELFNKDTVPYCAIPFEEQAYSKYLEGLVNCKISLNGSSKNFMMAFEKLVNMVYPLIGNGGNASIQRNYNNYVGANTNYNMNNNFNQAPNNFQNNINNTLDRMKNNY